MIADSTIVQIGLDVGSRASNLLEQLAARLGVAAAQLWPALVAKVRAEAIADLFVGLLLSTLALMLWRGTWRYGFKDEGAKFGLDTGTVAAVGSAVVLLLSVFAIVGFYSSVVEFLASEGVALTNLLRAITPK